MNSKGFTLIELVMILVLIGIMAVFAAPRLGTITATNAGAFADKLRTDIRYAQNLAMTKNQAYRVYFNGAPAPNPGYAVVYDTSGGAWSSFGYAQDPAAGGNLSIALNTGQYAGITTSTPPVGYVEFNSVGAATSGADVTITVNSDPALSLTVTARTGAVN